MTDETFDIAELVQLAVNDEAPGVAFYTALASKAQSPEIKRMFSDLADQERYHQRRFEEMLVSLTGEGAAQPTEADRNYLEALTSLLAFPDTDSARRMAAGCVDDDAAVELATLFERDTLLLMQEMKALVPEKDHDVLEQLIDEERAHVVVLTQAARRLKG